MREELPRTQISDQPQVRVALSEPLLAYVYTDWRLWNCREVVAYPAAVCVCVWGGCVLISIVFELIFNLQDCKL